MQEKKNTPVGNVLKSIYTQNHGRPYKQNALQFMLHLGSHRSLMAEHLHWAMKQMEKQTDTP